MSEVKLTSEDQRALNDDHAKHPLVGDYWHEMLKPMATVLMVDQDHVLVDHHCGSHAGTPHLMSRSAFDRYFRYDSPGMRHVMWADVVPGSGRLALEKDGGE